MNAREVEYYTRDVEQYERYQGIPMICERGLHPLLIERARPWLPKPGARVLDVGCGRGALSLRLADLGYQVDAIDKFDLCMCRERVRFILGDAEQLRDLGGVAYDAVFMVELIEHLNSPFEVMAQYLAYLKPGGCLIVSTPNVDADFSRAWFFLKGRHWYFEDSNLQRDGHIAPIHRFQMEHWAKQLGLNVVQAETVLENRTFSFFKMLTSFDFLELLIGLLRLHQQLRHVKPVSGKVAIYVLQEPAATTSA